MVSRSEAGKFGWEKTRQQLMAHIEAQKQTAREKYEASAPKCACCGSIIPFEKRQNKFCNHSCAAKVNNQGVVRNGQSPARRTHCLHCKEPISSNGLLYCSKQCATAHRVDKTIESLVANNGIRHSSKTIRLYLISIRGEQCEECGWNRRHSVIGRVPLEIDHVDGNFENNALDNLKLLCPNCHALTPTFRNLNKGKGRAYRRKTPE